MSGTRTRTGCYTCRLRKKKCDEEKPFCSNCCSRDIHCYGYGAKPDWMLGIGSWKEIMESKEAKFIRESAEATYKRRRRDRGASKQRGGNGLESEEHGERQDVELRNPSKMTGTSIQKAKTDSLKPVYVDPDMLATEVVQRRKQITEMANITNTMDYVWWNNSLPFEHLTRRPDMRLLMTFLDVIFPLQFGFYGLPRKPDRSWLVQNLIESEPLYEASLSVTMSFESVMRNGEAKELQDLDPDARKLQLGALRGLQQRVNELGAETYHGRELLKRGMQALAIMTQLLSLEVFSFVEGQWEIHLQAARTILGMFQHKWAPELFAENWAALEASIVSEIPTEGYSADDLKALNFFITAFVWVDIIARATNGPPPFNPQHFDYVPLLRSGYLKPQEIMGCQSCILVAISEVTAIEAWKDAQLEQGCLSVVELAKRASALIDHLNDGIEGLESRLRNAPTNLKEDSEAVNLVFAYGALVYLHTVVSGPSPHIPEIKYNVTRCLQKFEQFPARLLVRNCWPFTITGCMATEDQYDRFRNVVARNAAAKEPLGVTWKGLKVMEECWRLRKVEPGMWFWRTAMDKMEKRILLI